MIEIHKVEDDLTYTIDLLVNYESSKLIDRTPDRAQTTLTLTGKDLKKLVMLLNLTIGNVPDNAPDVTGLVDNIYKGMGFQP